MSPEVGLDQKFMSMAVANTLADNAITEMLLHRDSVNAEGGFVIIKGNMIPTGGNSDVLKNAIKESSSYWAGRAARTFEGITLDSSEDEHLIPIAGEASMLWGFIHWDKSSVTKNKKGEDVFGTATIIQRGRPGFEQYLGIFKAMKGTEKLRKYPKRFERGNPEIHPTGIMSKDEPYLVDEMEVFAMREIPIRLGRKIYTNPSNPLYDKGDVLQYQWELMNLAIVTGWTAYYEGGSLEEMRVEQLKKIAEHEAEGNIRERWITSEGGRPHHLPQQLLRMGN